MKKHKKHWVSIKNYLPNFCLFGFHKRKIMVKANGKTWWTQYLGYGEFGNFDKKFTVTHWLCDIKDCGVSQ